LLTIVEHTLSVLYDKITSMYAIDEFHL